MPFQVFQMFTDEQLNAFNTITELSEVYNLFQEYSDMIRDYMIKFLGENPPPQDDAQYTSDFDTLNKALYDQFTPTFEKRIRELHPLPVIFTPIEEPIQEVSFIPAGSTVDEFGNILPPNLDASGNIIIPIPYDNILPLDTPVLEPVVEPVVEPVLEPVLEPVVEPVVGPVPTDNSVWSSDSLVVDESSNSSTW